MDSHKTQNVLKELCQAEKLKRKYKLKKKASDPKTCMSGKQAIHSRLLLMEKEAWFRV